MMALRKSVEALLVLGIRRNAVQRQVPHWGHAVTHALDHGVIRPVERNHRASLRAGPSCCVERLINRLSPSQEEKVHQIGRVIVPAGGPLLGELRNYSMNLG